MRTRPTLSWTAGGPPLPRTTRLDEVVELVDRGGVLVLSGAGLSTESGIPDYRGAAGSLRKHTPMTYGEFVADPDARRRYWARSHVGWRTIARAAPNAGHRAVTALHARGHLTGVITQNVDGLHQAAGTPDVVELHGGLDRVVCLSCREPTPREDLDRRLAEANPDFSAEAAPINPDGDVDLDDTAVADFRVVACRTCDGVLKPDVVFFGENVPRPRVDLCNALVDAAASVLVLGSSLTVMSGLRFIRRAATTATPVAIINQGETRGDQHATHRVDLPLGHALTELRSRLSA
ncbi:NAD-dependent protein deacetylase of SIR2 family [Actinokineospora spheciospongiae]|uniref:NAD-dependent protein deacetylase n=1 Tax=Actinokineospora spheciospongiae TaxID=909613 RepID=W7IS47_9PSEU|nr:NAD-dependent protein deacetylase [Actinokineospora spheciospongiae]EWC63168.1 NAD-dependent protein deacetylase of SIR2 family [Actinokineospora spheciospongiae]